MVGVVGAVIVPSDALKEHIVACHSRAAGKTFRVYPGIEERRDAEPHGCEWGERPRLLFVGRIDRDKRPLHAVEVFERILKRCGHGSLHLVGSGPQMGELAVEVARRGLSERVSLHGYWSDRAVAAAYREADVVIVTSEYESLSLVALEALSAGCRAVAYGVGGIGEVVGRHRCGRLVPSGDLEAMELAIMGLLGVAPSHEEGGHFGERFTIEEMGRQTAIALEHSLVCHAGRGLGVSR